MKEVYDKYGLEATTRDFIGHSMALYQSDEYIQQPGMAKETVQRIRLYVNSMARYGKSPYIYPLYGLGELPQGFARLSAIYGGTYMLNTTVEEIEYDERGRVAGIRATMKGRDEAGEGMRFATKTKKIIADPSYFPGKVRVVAHLLKAICILNHPVANTDNADSAQLIIPQSQIGRKNGPSPFLSFLDSFPTPFRLAFVSLSFLRPIISTSSSIPPFFPTPFVTHYPQDPDTSHEINLT